MAEKPPPCRVVSVEEVHRDLRCINEGAGRPRRPYGITWWYRLLRIYNDAGGLPSIALTIAGAM
jgi:hypothetical protein